MHIDEINTIRVQEEVEREWRRKEKEEALRKLQVKNLLWKEREEQINNKRIMQAIEIERDRRDFERIVREQEAGFYKEKRELEQKQQQALIHRTAILKQVCLNSRIWYIYINLPKKKPFNRSMISNENSRYFHFINAIR